MDRLIVVMGVSGSGKSTVAMALAQHWNWPYLEADTFHSPANIAKMKSGVSLTDRDREAWIDGLRTAIEAQPDPTVIATCSALSETVRVRLTEGLRRAVVWCWLQVDEDTARDRVRERRNHFMPASLVTSQFHALDPPETAWRVDAARPLSTILADLNPRLEACLTR